MKWTQVTSWWTNIGIFLELCSCPPEESSSNIHSLSALRETSVFETAKLFLSNFVQLLFDAGKVPHSEFNRGIFFFFFFLNSCLLRLEASSLRAYIPKTKAWE